MSIFSEETIHIENLRVECIIGIHPHEREHTQPLLISLSIPWSFAQASASEEIAATVNYSAVAKETTRFVQEGKFQLLETLARRLAQHLGSTFGLGELHLYIQKPEAVAASDGAAVSLTWEAEEETP